jgi:hypothetical protein
MRNEGTNSMARMISLHILGVIILSLFVGCQTTYYAVWEQLGKEKRHLLKDQVEKARSDQEEASEQFKDVLTRIKEMYGFEGGDLEEFYNKLKSDYEECERRADMVTTRIDKVEQIAADLFVEWEKEIDDISNSKLRSLTHLNDYVLYLKHNLNAQAVGALKEEVGDIEGEVDRLIKDMSKSIKEAEEFLKTFES